MYGFSEEVQLGVPKKVIKITMSEPEAHGLQRDLDAVCQRGFKGEGMLHVQWYSEFEELKFLLLKLLN